MATEEEKARNKRLREEAMQAKFARETRQSPRPSEAREADPAEGARTVAKTFGGLSGGAARALMGRKRQVDEALD